MPDEGIGCGFTEAVRGVLSHHMVIRDGKIANYHPYPPTPWNANPRDIYGTPGPYEDAVQGQPIFEENDRGALQGHRHHADGAQLRPVPALRRAHVPRRRQDARDGCTRRRSRSPASDRRGDRERRGAVRGRQRSVATGSRRCSRRAPPAVPVARERAEELVRARRRAVRRRAGAGARDRRTRPAALDDEALDALADDELVAGLLLVHGLHPYDVDDAGRAGARQGAALSRLARRRRRAARGRRRGRRPAAPARQLRRLPVVGGDAAARGRGRGRGRRAGDHPDRGRDAAPARRPRR